MGFGCALTALLPRTRTSHWSINAAVLGTLPELHYGKKKKEHTLHLLQRQDDAAGPCKNTWNSQTQGVMLAKKKKKRSTFTATWRKHLNQHFELTAINYNQLQETTFKFLKDHLYHQLKFMCTIL